MPRQLRPRKRRRQDMAGDDGSHRSREEEAIAEASHAPTPHVSLIFWALRGEGEAREGPCGRSEGVIGTRVLYGVRLDSHRE